MYEGRKVWTYIKPFKIKDIQILSRKLQACATVTNVMCIPFFVLLI